jgi:anti-sigma-K factor RskA
MTFDHDDTRASAYVLGTLEPGERDEFAVHLTTCDACQEEVRSLQRVVTALAAAAPTRTPPAELRDRVLNSIPGGHVGRVPPDPPPAIVSQSRSSSWGDPRVWLPAAALLALSIGLSFYANTLRQRIGVLEARLDVAIRDGAASRLAVANAEQTAMRAQRTMAVLADPDMAKIDLAGQKGAPSARARAFWSRNRGLVMAVNDLPALQSGRTYQVWVLPASGAAPISAGLLVPDGSGSATVMYDTASDIPAPGAVAVSEEPAGGVPAPTGQIYLVGKVT